MKQNSSLKFYFSIIMALMLFSCSKNDEVLSTNNSNFSVETAKSYFEKCFISGTVTKSSEELKNSNKLFYTGDFTPQWEKAEYDENQIFEGYYVDLLLPKYKFIVERGYYDDGIYRTFEVPVHQKLIVMHEPGTGKVYNYILSLIPDKHYHERNSSKDLKSFSDWKEFSGIAMYTNPKTGVMVSVARFINGRKLSHVHMLATSYEGMAENAQKAFRIIGEMKLKSKVRLLTKGPDGGGNGDDGNYNDGPCWELDKYTYLGGGYYWDGEDVWEDVDGDGMPDRICIEPPVIEGEAGNGSGGNPYTPPTDPFDGIGGGSADSGGGGGGNGENGENANPDDGISDAEAYELGYYYLEKINDDILNDNYTECGFDLTTISYNLTPFNFGLNVQGLWSSWLSVLDDSKLLNNFGKALSGAGFILGVPQAYTTVVAIIEGNTEKLSPSDIMNLVSTGLSGIVALGVVGGTAAAVAGFSGAIIGVASLFVNDNYGGQMPVRIELDNGVVITLLYA